MDELQVNELDSVEGFFDDYAPEDTTESATSEEPVEESTEAVETTEEPTSEIVEEPADTSFLRVKFNGEERALTEDEARTLAQKGMNYDRFYEPLERLARMNNMSVGDYVNQLNNTQEQYEMEKEKDNLRNDPKYQNLDEEILDEIAQSRVKEMMGQREQYFADQSKQQAEAEQARAQREVDHFLEEYPEFRHKDPSTLDPKVYEFVKQGYTLLEAYNKFQREMVNQQQMDLKVKASQKNEENRKKSLGNTSNAGNTDDDPFLKGFLAD